jgi:hypothetical protein
MWANNLFENCVDKEPALTALLESLFGDKLQGLEYRQKAVSAIAAKLKRIAKSSIFYTE